MEYDQPSNTKHTKENASKVKISHKYIGSDRKHDDEKIKVQQNYGPNSSSRRSSQEYNKSNHASINSVKASKAVNYISHRSKDADSLQNYASKSKHTSESGSNGRGIKKAIGQKQPFVYAQPPAETPKKTNITSKINFDPIENLLKLRKEYVQQEIVDSVTQEGKAHKVPLNKYAKPHKTNTNYQKVISSERVDTLESDISALNLSPKSRAALKLKKYIAKYTQKTGLPPDSSSDFYRVGKVLGRGAFGKVNLAIHRLSEEMVAIKSINKEFLNDENSKNKVMKEMRILRKIRHKNIVQLLDTFETSKHIIFVMELCSGGDLLNYVRKRRKLSEDYAKAIFKQILDALHYCHKKNILHRDIKLDNIILDSEGVIKLGDFGVSKIVDPTKPMFDQCGTPAYIAPEILRDKGYTGFGIDVWSAGVVLYAMLYGTVPFRAQNMSELHDMIVKAKYSLKSTISDDAKDLLKRVLEPDPRKRLKIPEILAHAWFNDVKEDLQMFTDQEKEKIKQEFSYNDVNHHNKIHESDVSVDFTEHRLETEEDDDLRNLTTKSLILAPFNSTTSIQSDDILLEMEKMLLPRKAIKFSSKCRDFNRQYEMNNNCELDNGVYNKFMCSSRASLNFSPSNADDDEDKSDGLSGGDSLEMDFNKNENELEHYDEHDMDDQIEKLVDEDINKHNLESSQLENILTHTHENMDESEDIDDVIVEEIHEYGYNTEFIHSSIINNEINYPTASYYLIKKRKDYKHNL